MNKLVGRILVLALAGALTAAAIHYFLASDHGALPAGIAAGNGRLEATEVDVASKLAGRLAAVQPKEGDWVAAGAVLARLDAEDIAAQLRVAQAQVQQARMAGNESRAGLRKSQADLTLADKSLRRSQELVGRGFVSRSRLDGDQSGMEGAMAGVAQSRSKVDEANAAVAAALARADSLQVTLDDTVLRAPVAGRVLYRLAEPGEVVGAGGKVLTLVDLSEIYMTIYLPTTQAGQVALGSDARIVLDGLPAEVIPARVVFVAAKAQFTPREVETRSEREKLMFRLKIRAEPAWLEAHRDLAKSGMPGIAYVRLDSRAVWPEYLRVK